MGKAYKQNDLWVVNLDEAEWYGAGVDQEALKASYIGDARLSNCIMLAVFVVPDALFSMCGHTTRHRVFEYRFEQKNAAFRVEAHFIGTIEDAIYSDATEQGRLKLVRTVRDALNDVAGATPGRYVISLASGKLIERGRVGV